MSITLAHSPADIVRSLMLNLGLGTDPNASPLGSWPIYVAGEPAQPEECITVLDVEPQPDGRSMVDGESWFHYGLQIRLRATSHTDGWLKAAGVARILSENVNGAVVSVDSSNYVVNAITKIRSPLVAGKMTPSSKRSLFLINCFVSLRAVS